LRKSHVEQSRTSEERVFLIESLEEKEKEYVDEISKLAEQSNADAEQIQQLKEEADQIRSQLLDSEVFLRLRCVD